MSILESILAFTAVIAAKPAAKKKGDPIVEALVKERDLAREELQIASAERDMLRQEIAMLREANTQLLLQRDSQIIAQSQQVVVVDTTLNEGQLTLVGRRQLDPREWFGGVADFCNCVPSRAQIMEAERARHPRRRR